MSLMRLCPDHHGSVQVFGSSASVRATIVRRSVEKHCRDLGVPAIDGMEVPFRRGR
jgi:hypothetical protein